MAQQSNKSLFLAYLFLFLGGFFGLHQFYLGRYRHGFALWISFGGYFCLGLIRELWRMPEYVQEVNGDKIFMTKLIQQMQHKPLFSWVRYLGSIIVADILGYLIMGALPHELFSEDGTSDNVISRILITILVPIACAFGVHLVGNIGRYCGTIKWPLLAAYLTSPLYWFQINSVFLTSTISVIAFSKYSLQWRRTPLDDRSSRQSWIFRFTVLILCSFLYLSLWTSWFYFNCTVTDKNDETIKCRVAVKNFFNSPAWLKFRVVMQSLWNFIRTQGISGLWKEIVDALDPQGEKNALKILGLNDSHASDAEITSNYRRLARQWHPDKHSTEEEKRQAQEKFLEIQEAYELLSKMKRKRTKINSD